MFELRGVKYKEILDIGELNLSNNKITSIVGESGSGKTTLLRLLNKILPLSSGDVFYRGVNLKDISSIQLRRQVVMLPQSPAIFPGTIEENLLKGLVFSEKPLAPRDQLLEVLSMVRLNKCLTADSEKLSGGEKQRLALARIILMDPEVFLLDEPSSALDEETEELIISQMVNHVKARQKPLIMVTHSKKIAQSFSDVIVEIKSGKIIALRKV